MYDEKKARKDMLESLRNMMKQEDGADVGEALGKHKVTVAADSKEGLMKGLSKAEQIMKKHKDMMGLDDEPKAEKEEKKPELSKDDLKAKIEKYKKILEDME
jgi:flagellar biosynthesis/type III secretory pathway chaperone